MFEESIIKEIMDAWLTDQAHPHRDRKKKPLPHAQDIRVILETAFLASLKYEEERSITFSIALLRQADIATEEESSGRRQVILPFKEPIPFSVHSITKIAPAFDIMNSSLLVTPKDDSRNEYEIWGTIFYRPAQNRLTAIPFGAELLRYFRPDVLTTQSISPGSLAISRGDSLIGRFVDGAFQQSTPTPIGYALAPYLVDAIKDHDGFLKFKNNYWLLYRDVLLYLLSEASKRGHGGIIVLLPCNKVEQYKKCIVPKYVFKNQFDLKDLILTVLNCGKGDIVSNVGYTKGLAERLDFIAQLSCVDGALIMTADLEILSFGSTLTASRWTGPTIKGTDGLGSDEFAGGGEIIDISKFGTKHNSAVNFAGECPDSIVFVISQDGPVRLLVRKGEQRDVLYWQDCLSSMFISN